MSHLVCPLCGKNAPLSTYDPDNLDLDLRVVSFKGLGRGRGFAKAEENSVLGDDEYSPIVAARTVELCAMFIQAGVLSKEEVAEELGLGSITLKEKEQLEALSQQLYAEQMNRVVEQRKYLADLESERWKNIRLKNELHRIEKENEERRRNEEQKAIVDLILSEGLTLLEDTGVVEVEGSEWRVNLDDNVSELVWYLAEVYRYLPWDLGQELLARVNGDDLTLFFLENYPRAPPELSLMDRMLEDLSVFSRGPDGSIRYELAPPVQEELSLEAVEPIIAEAKKNILSMIEEPV